MDGQRVDRTFDALAQLIGDGSQPYDQQLAAEYAAAFWDAVEARNATGDRAASWRPTREEVEAMTDLPTAEIIEIYGCQRWAVYDWFEYYGIKHNAKGQRAVRQRTTPMNEQQLLGLRLAEARQRAGMRNG